MKAFHAYDIRGIYNKDFNKTDVYRIGYFLPQVLQTKKILIGQDVRVSSQEISDHLCQGLMDAGVEVFHAGLCTTPFIYWATARYGFDASVMITASHNSAEYNGLKVSGRKAEPIGYQDGLNKIEEKVISNDPIVSSPIKGRITGFDHSTDYMEFLKSYKGDTGNLNLAIDCSNGMAGLYIEEFFHHDCFFLNKEPDGHFPGHDPNPLNPANVEQLIAAVLDNKSDVGVIFDGDADRVMFVDNQGRFVSPDLIIAILGHHFLKGKPKGQIVLQDIRTSKSVSEYLDQFGAQVHTWKVGRAFAARKLKELNGIYGGELAGHYYFRDFYFSDSGLLACLLTLKVLAEFKTSGISFAQLIDQVKGYENSGELNFTIQDKGAAMEAVKRYFTDNEIPVAVFDFDGYRLEFEQWWFNIRPSNTEPYLRLLVEANTTDLLVEKVQELESVLKQFM